MESETGYALVPARQQDQEDGGGNVLEDARETLLALGAALFRRARAEEARPAAISVDEGAVAVAPLGGVGTYRLRDTLSRLTSVERAQVLVVLLHVTCLALDFRHWHAGDVATYSTHPEPEHAAIVAAYFLLLLYSDARVLATLLTYPDQVPGQLSLWMLVRFLSLGASVFLTEVLGVGPKPACVLPGLPRLPTDVLLAYATPAYCRRTARWLYHAGFLSITSYVLAQNTRMDLLMRVPDLDPVFTEDDLVLDDENAPLI